MKSRSIIAIFFKTVFSRYKRLLPNFFPRYATTPFFIHSKLRTRVMIKIRLSKAQSNLRKISTSEPYLSNKLVELRRFIYTNYSGMRLGQWQAGQVLSTIR